MDIQRSILVIDDDQLILKIIDVTLSRDGYRVLSADSSKKGFELLSANSVDLIILDLNLPDIDGFEVARQVRTDSDIPILMLTAAKDVESTIAGLDAGADDYLRKPFDPNELNARVRSLLRRCDMNRRTTPGIFEYGDWQLDTKSHTLIGANGVTSRLTEREVRILAALMHRPGSIISRTELTRQVAGREWDASDRSLDVHMSHLRRKISKLSDDASAPLKTVRGRGFTFSP